MKKKAKQEQNCAMFDEPVVVIKDIAFTDEILDALEISIKKEYPFISGEKEYLSIQMLERLLVIDLYRKVLALCEDRTEQTLQRRRAGDNMLKEGKKENSYEITAKGLAMIAAVESGLLPKIEGGWDDANFNIFWDKFEKLLKEEGYSILKISKD